MSPSSGRARPGRTSRTGSSRRGRIGGSRSSSGRTGSVAASGPCRWTASRTRSSSAACATCPAIGWSSRSSTSSGSRRAPSMPPTARADFLRGVVGSGPDDPLAGRGYDLPDGESGRSAYDLMRAAFLKIVPQARELDEAGWRRHRATATFGGRPLTDWSISEAVATILSPEGHRFATDAFGYDSGIHPHNAGDAIQYVMGTGYPSGEARVPVDGMDRIPRELAARFAALGGAVRLGHDVQRVEAAEGSVVARLRRRLGRPGAAARPDAADPGPSRRSPSPPRSSTGRPGGGCTGRSRAYRRRSSTAGTTDHGGATARTPRPASGRRPTCRTGRSSTSTMRPIDPPRCSPPSPTSATTSRSSPWPKAEVGEHRPRRPCWRRSTAGWTAAHPGAEVPALPVGSAFQHWGADPREVAWHFWRSGDNSDEMIDLAAQPDPIAADPHLRRGLLPPRRLGRRCARDRRRRGPHPTGISGGPNT